MIVRTRDASQPMINGGRLVRHCPGLIPSSRAQRGRTHMENTAQLTMRRGHCCKLIRSIVIFVLRFLITGYSYLLDKSMVESMAVHFIRSSSPCRVSSRPPRGGRFDALEATSCVQIFRGSASAEVTPNCAGCAWMGGACLEVVYLLNFSVTRYTMISMS